MGDSDKFYIDVEEVFKSKAPKTAKWIPSFVFRYLKKLIHQKEINCMICRGEDFYGLPFVDIVLKEFNTKVEVEGSENIIGDRMLFASNHPMGGLDGIALIDTVGKFHPEVVTPVNDILMFVPNLRPLFIPVNKHGSNAENIRLFNDTFAGDKTICYYPFGLCSRKKNGKIVDLEWKKTFITKARTYQRDIVPTHISGRNSDFFYNLSNFRKALHIKANIEMIFLVNEFYKQKNKTLKITFGKPIPWQTFDKRYSDAEWAEKLRRFSYKLDNNYNIDFNPDED